MLQRGIETPDMDVRWVSSLSWYFLNFLGLNGLYRIILGGDNCKHHCPTLPYPLHINVLHCNTPDANLVPPSPFGDHH